jgi:transketolase
MSAMPDPPDVRPAPAAKELVLDEDARLTKRLARDNPSEALLATGSEVSIALTAREMLARDGIVAAVVSMPCWELFEAQPQAYRDAVLGAVPKVGIEAAVQFGWERWLGPRGAFIGKTGFGASAPGEALYPHFGITAERVAEAARSLL